MSTKPTTRRRSAEQRRARNARERERAATKRDQVRAARQARLATGGAAPMLLSRDDLRDFYGVSYSRAALYRLIAAGEFPAPVALGPQRTAWRRDEIERWAAKLKRVAYAAAEAV